jgi:ferredoxin
MADKENKVPDNIPGSFYVDTSCIACGICIAEAPDTFKYNEDESLAYVYAQPANEEHTASAKQALNHCTADAIGDDG